MVFGKTHELKATSWDEFISNYSEKLFNVFTEIIYNLTTDKTVKEKQYKPSKETLTGKTSFQVIIRHTKSTVEGCIIYIVTNHPNIDSYLDNIYKVWKTKFPKAGVLNKNNIHIVSATYESLITKTCKNFLVKVSNKQDSVKLENIFSCTKAHNILNVPDFYEHTIESDEMWIYPPLWSTAKYLRKQLFPWLPGSCEFMRPNSIYNETQNDMEFIKAMHESEKLPAKAFFDKLSNKDPILALRRYFKNLRSALKKCENGSSDEVYVEKRILYQDKVLNQMKCLFEGNMTLDFVSDGLIAFREEYQKQRDDPELYSNVNLFMVLPGMSVLQNWLYYHGVMLLKCHTLKTKEHIVILCLLCFPTIYYNQFKMGINLLLSGGPALSKSYIYGVFAKITPKGIIVEENGGQTDMARMTNKDQNYSVYIKDELPAHVMNDSPAKDRDKTAIHNSFMTAGKLTRKVFITQPGKEKGDPSIRTYTNCITQTPKLTYYAGNALIPNIQAPIRSRFKPVTVHRYLKKDTVIGCFMDQKKRKNDLTYQDSKKMYSQFCRRESIIKGLIGLSMRCKSVVQPTNIIGVLLLEKIFKSLEDSGVLITEVRCPDRIIELMDAVTICRSGNYHILLPGSEEHNVNIDILKIKNVEKNLYTTIEDAVTAVAFMVDELINPGDSRIINSLFSNIFNIDMGYNSQVKNYDTDLIKMFSDWQTQDKSIGFNTYEQQQTLGDGILQQTTKKFVDFNYLKFKGSIEDMAKKIVINMEPSPDEKEVVEFLKSLSHKTIKTRNIAHIPIENVKELVTKYNEGSIVQNDYLNVFKYTESNIQIINEYNFLTQKGNKFSFVIISVELCRRRIMTYFHSAIKSLAYKGLKDINTKFLVPHDIVPHLQTFNDTSFSLLELNTKDAPEELTLYGDSKVTNLEKKVMMCSYVDTKTDTVKNQNFFSGSIYNKILSHKEIKIKEDINELSKNLHREKLRLPYTVDKDGNRNYGLSAEDEAMQKYNSFMDKHPNIKKFYDSNNNNNIDILVDEPNNPNKKRKLN